MTHFVRRILVQFLNCLTFMTRLQIPGARSDNSFSLKDSLWSFAPVGLVVGGLGAGCFVIVSFLGLNLALTVILVLAVTALITGALHEDGLADFCDGLGVMDRDKALLAMGDSRIGSFGAIGLVFAFLWKGAALYQLESGYAGAAALMAAHAGGRGLIVPLFLLPFAGQRGLAYAAGQAGRQSVMAALIVMLIILLVLLPLKAVFYSLIVGFLVIGLIGYVALKKFGGVTGDVYGAAEQAGEMAILGVVLGCS